MRASWRGHAAATGVEAAIGEAGHLAEGVSGQRETHADAEAVGLDGRLGVLLEGDPVTAAQAELALLGLDPRAAVQLHPDREAAGDLHAAQSGNTDATALNRAFRRVELQQLPAVRPLHLLHLVHLMCREWSMDLPETGVYIRKFGGDLYEFATTA